MIWRFILIPLLLAAGGCKDDSVIIVPEPKAEPSPLSVDCDALKARVAKFNALSAEQQQHDVATLEMLRNLPNPVQLEQLVFDIFPTMIVVKSDGCEVSVIAKSGNAQANIRAE